MIERIMEKMKNLYGEIMEEKKIMFHLFNENQIELAFLFGSLLETEKSRDIDIAILFRDYSFDRYINTYEDLCRILKTRKMDLVVLNRSNPAIKLEAAIKGRVLFSKDIDTEVNFITSTLFEYEDYVYFKKECLARLKRRIKEGISMAERRLNKERIVAYLTKLAEACTEIKELKEKFSSFEDFMKDKSKRELGVHYLRIALESVLDVCRHFLAVKGVSLTELNSTNLIELCGLKGFIPYPFANKIKGMVGMRNAIVHVYWNLDYNAIYKAINERLSDFDEFAKRVEEFLEKEPI